jgi:Glutaredoxin-like domain (DUF836)
MPAPSHTIVLYSKDGCESCAETRELLLALLEERPDGGDDHLEIEIRDVATDPAWERAFGAEVPVVEIGDRRLPLATSAARLRQFLAEALDPLPTR